MQIIDLMVNYHWSNGEKGTDYWSNNNKEKPQIIDSTLERIKFIDPWRNLRLDLELQKKGYWSIRKSPESPIQYWENFLQKKKKKIIGKASNLEFKPGRL